MLGLEESHGLTVTGTWYDIMLMQALEAAHQADCEAVTSSKHEAAKRIEEVGRALLTYKANLMDNAKAEYDRARENARQTFNEEYNVRRALIESKMQELKHALEECSHSLQRS